jgi:hypothetical protein
MMCYMRNLHDIRERRTFFPWEEGDVFMPYDPRYFGAARASRPAQNGTYAVSQQMIQDPGAFPYLMRNFAQRFERTLARELQFTRRGDRITITYDIDIV